MNAVIKKFFILLMLFIPPGIWAQESGETVDLSITISSLALAGETGENIPAAGTEVVLNGTVIERAVVNPDEETFSAELLMASGKWTASEDVEISSCLVLLNGPEYAAMVPARRSRTENPAEIPLNSELLVYGFFLGYAETENGPLAVIRAGGVRKL